jgi:hypothetical protein
MGRNKGISSFSANFEPQIAAPLDARFLVAYKNDLTSATTWLANNDLIYTYKGMIVSVYNDSTLSNNGIYRLKDDDYTIESNWEKILNSGSTLNIFDKIILNKTLNSNIGVIEQSGKTLIHTYCTKSEEVAPGIFADQNIFIGKYCGNYTNSGVNNFVFGQLAGTDLTTGGANSFMGAFAGKSTTTGNANVYIGNSSGAYNTIGEYQTFIGWGAGFASNTGTYNTFIGGAAGYSNGSDENTMIGVDAGMNNGGGTLNVFIGNEVAFNNSGSRNVIVGAYAAYNNTGHNNVFIGCEAGYNEPGNNKLIISNTSNTSLIYGEFDNSYLKFNANKTYFKNIIELNSGLFKPVYNSTTAFTFANSSSTAIFTIDSVNNIIKVNKTSYENYITNDNDIPNKKYVDNIIKSYTGITTNSAATTIIIENISNNQVLTYKGIVQAVASTGTTNSWDISGTIRNYNGITTIISGTTENIIVKENNNWSIIPQANNTNDRLEIIINGQNNTTINWKFKLFLNTINF